jgi:hypothetical protein
MQLSERCVGRSSAVRITTAHARCAVPKSQRSSTPPRDRAAGRHRSARLSAARALCRHRDAWRHRLSRRSPHAAAGVDKSVDRMRQSCADGVRRGFTQFRRVGIDRERPASKKKARSEPKPASDYRASSTLGAATETRDRIRLFEACSASRVETAGPAFIHFFKVKNAGEFSCCPAERSWRQTSCRRG